MTGLKYDFESGCMFSGGQELECIDIRLALLKLIDYVSKREKPILVGHNVLSFDIPILSKKLQEHGLLQEFLRHVSDCLDTLRLARKLFNKETVGNYKQQTLVQVLLGKSYQAHDALTDVKNLYELFVSKKQMLFLSISMSYRSHSYHSLKGSLFRVQIQENLQILD